MIWFSRKIRKSGKIRFEVRKYRPSPFANGDAEKFWRGYIAEEAEKVVSEPLNVGPNPEFTMTIIFAFSEFSKRGQDLDNLAKPVLDTLFLQEQRSEHPVGKLFLCDDSCVTELTLRKNLARSPEDEGARIDIRWHQKK